MRQFDLNTPLFDEFDDMPAAPGVGGTTEVEVSGEGVAGMFDDVPEMGEAIPMGTYHFRLERYSSGASAVKVDNKLESSPRKRFADGTEIPDQPWFQLFWSCQQEPHTGRVFTDFMPWVSLEVVSKAAAGDTEAIAIRKDRLWKAKAVCKAAGFGVAGNFNIKTDFLDVHPELKIQVGLEAGKTKVNGKYVADGSQRNKPIKYLSLSRPS